MLPASTNTRIHSVVNNNAQARNIREILDVFGKDAAHWTKPLDGGGGSLCVYSVDMLFLYIDNNIVY
jgi:hypothetical protein